MPPLMPAPAPMGMPAACSAAALACTTLFESGLMNGAFAELDDDGAFAFAANDHRLPEADAAPSSLTERAAGEIQCRETLVLVGVHRAARSGGSSTAPQLGSGTSTLRMDPGSSLYLPAAIPRRRCHDITNFRSNGPEDPRLLPLGAGHRGQVLMFYPDFVEHPAEGGYPSYGRQIFMRLLSLNATTGELLLGKKLRLVSAGPEVATLGRLEKNWSPFVANGTLYVHQWLDNGNGSAVALRVNRTSGRLTHRYETSNSGLHEAVGAPAGAHLRGGTPAIQLNATHFLAVGHSRSNRSYGMFCYLFSSQPPFHLLGATPEFAIKPLEADFEGEGINWHPPHAAHGRVQFPSGLHWSNASAKWLQLSWGYRDRDTMLSQLRLSHVLARVRPIIPND